LIHDALELKLLDDIGVGNMMVETDFPHNSTWYPHSMQKAQEWLRGLSDGARWKVLRRNAQRVFSFTTIEAPALGP
jgi:predicted TIM-barrel fold metal-dependent hydrolase